MTQGRCALCLKNGHLLESHFISKGIYRITARDSGPVVMTPDLFISTSMQVKDHLLCEVCEQRFGKTENYVIPLLWRGEKSFPLLAALKAAKPLGPGHSGSLVYSGPACGLDIDRIAYYALSMFWRASVHVWKTLNGQTISTALRTHEEPIRKFLNEESTFPVGVVLQVEVCSDLMSQGTVFPPLEWSNDLYTGYEMTVLGVRFTLVVGVRPGAKEWDLCCVNSKDKLVFLKDCSETSREHYLDLRGKARTARNLS